MGQYYRSLYSVMKNYIGMLLFRLLLKHLTLSYFKSILIFIKPQGVKEAIYAHEECIRLERNFFLIAVRAKFQKVI